MSTSQRPSQTSFASSYSHDPNSDERLRALPISQESQLEFFFDQRPHQRLSVISASLKSLGFSGRTRGHSHRLRCLPSAICGPLTLILTFLLLPSVTLLVLILCYRVVSGNNLLATSITGIEDDAVYVDLSATLLTTISSISSTLAPFLIGMIMVIWGVYVAWWLIQASEANSDTYNIYNPLPKADEFSILANMRAGRCDQLLKLISFRRHTSQERPPMIRMTMLIMFICVFVTFLTFLGDQFFHVWSESKLIYQYDVPDNYSSFGKGLAPVCFNFNRSENYGSPCSRPGEAFLSEEEYNRREAEIGYISTNTSQTSQIQFIANPDLADGDLAVLYPVRNTSLSRIDYRAGTIGVSTQCKFMTQACKITYLSNILTQFNCSDTFFGILGKPANISYDLYSKPQDPDVPGLAWKVSPSLQYAFYSDRDHRIPYNVLGLNNITGNGDDIPLLPDSELVNPVFLAVAGRIAKGDMALDSDLTAESSSYAFLPTYGDEVYDFFLNCSYTTFDVGYTVVNRTTLPDFLFTPTPNGSVAEMWHGRQQFTSIDGDASKGLGASNTIAAKQKTPEDFAKEWANRYSTKVLSVIGAYTDPRLNLEEQVHRQKIVTRIEPWALGFLFAANSSYVLLALIVSAIAWSVSTAEVLRIADDMDLNKLIEENFVGQEMNDLGNDRGSSSATEIRGNPPVQGGLRVGVGRNRFESVYYAV